MFQDSKNHKKTGTKPGDTSAACPSVADYAQDKPVPAPTDQEYAALAHRIVMTKKGK